MKAKAKKLVRIAASAVTGIMAFGLFQASVNASSTDTLVAMNVGAATIIDSEDSLIASAGESESFLDKEKKKEAAQDSEEDDVVKSGLVVSNVKCEANVREDADENSEIIGKLYANCGGQALDAKKGWTKIKTGNLTGWVKSDYLLFGNDAKDAAKKAGGLVAKAKTQSLRIRKDASEDAGVYGLLSTGEIVTVKSAAKDGWVSVSFKGNTGYVSDEYVSLDYDLEEGKTLTEIAAEQKAAEEKKEAEKQKAAEKASAAAPQSAEISNKGAVAVEAADDQLLAALIQCEAGNQPYEGQLAVGATVMNRVRSGAYPNSVKGVIYASGQFPPAVNGGVAKILSKGVKSSCLQAAQQAIAGSSNIGSATRFKRAGSREGVVIGAHVFY